MSSHLLDCLDVDEIDAILHRIKAMVEVTRAATAGEADCDPDAVSEVMELLASQLTELGGLLAPARAAISQHIDEIIQDIREGRR